MAFRCDVTNDVALWRLELHLNPDRAYAHAGISATVAMLAPHPDQRDGIPLIGNIPYRRLDVNPGQRRGGWPECPSRSVAGGVDSECEEPLALAIAGMRLADTERHSACQLSLLYSSAFETTDGHGETVTRVRR